MNWAYTDEQVRYLAGRDARLGWAMERIGRVERETDGDLFASLMRHVLGQQISTAALGTLWARLTAQVGPPTPEAVAGMGEKALQALGTTHRKAGYLHALAQRVQSGALDLRSLSALPDAEVVRTLAAERGLGVWTAEMVLLLGMRRPDVVSYGDLGIRRGMRMLYAQPEITREAFARYAARYSPQGSVASLYLWAVAAGAIPELTDPAAPSPKPRRNPDRRAAP